MARFSTVDRESLEKILTEFKEDFSEDDSDLNLAHLVDELVKETPADQQPDLVKLRFMTVALNVMKATEIVEGSDPPRAFYLDNTVDQLKRLSLDLGMFPEELIRNKLFEKSEVYLPDASWEELSAKYTELVGDVRQTLIDAVKPKLLQARLMFAGK